MIEDDPNAIDQSTYINDIRLPDDFRAISFSKYKKTDVKKAFIDSMMKGRVEPACNWCAELICAGHYADIWELILYYMGKHIHLGNPKLVIYLEMRYSGFRDIIIQSQYTNELQVRNNDRLRKLFAEIVCILTYSNKRPSYEAIKINKSDEFDITQMTERLKAPNVHYAENIFRPKDPKELYIAINELAYHISKDNPNIMKACYWIEWVMEFDALCKKRKEPCYCEPRSELKVDRSCKRDIIWLVWDCILYYGKNCSPFIEKILASLLNLFCIKYTTASGKKRRYLLYFCIGLLTEPVPQNVELIGDKEIVHTVVKNINKVYRQIKKNEESPGTDYLFNGLVDMHNRERSIRQIELVNSITIGGCGINEHDMP
jgi:hypothetical protein